MPVSYKTCGNCNHAAERHGSNGKCGVRSCSCQSFTPKQVG